MIKAIQFTDPHLFADKQGDLLGVNTLDSFQQVMQLIKKESADLYFATGDFAQDESLEAYQHLFAELKTLNKPILFCYGNHDDRDLIQQLKIPAEYHFLPCYDAENWRFIFVDTQDKGKVSGLISDESLARLQQCLSDADDRHTALIMHHHPVSMGSTWLDKHILINSDDFWQVVDQFDNVRGVLWGHVHQAYQNYRRNVLLASCPSTCIQFQCGNNDFAIDPLSKPGFRRWCFHDDGQITTEVIRLEHYDYHFNDNVTQGY